MITGSLSRRYAKALFELAVENGQEEALQRQLDRFVAAYARSPLAEVLNNPRFDRGSRRRVLHEVMQALELSPLAGRFLSLLFDRQRLDHLSGVAAMYRQMLNDAKGRVEATVASAHPLEPETLERLRQTLRGLSGKQVLLQQKTDPGLIGGLVVELEGKVYDGSVRTQLDKMRQRIAREY